MEFHYLGDMGLDKDDAFPRVHAGCQPVEHHLTDVVLYFAGIGEGGEGVDVNRAVDTVVLLLEGDIVLDGTQQVADVLPAGGTRPGKDTFLHMRFSLLKSVA